VFNKAKVCDVACEVWVVLRRQEDAVKLATAGWKQCEWVCGVDIRLVDLARVATWKVDLKTKNVGHHWSSLYIPVSNAVAEWVFSHVTAVFKMWKSVILKVFKTGINAVSFFPCLFLKLCVFLLFSTAQWRLRHTGSPGLARFLDYDLYRRTQACLPCVFVPLPMVPLHYVVYSGSFLWAFSLFLFSFHVWPFARSKFLFSGP